MIMIILTLGVVVHAICQSHSYKLILQTSREYIIIKRKTLLVIDSRLNVSRFGVFHVIPLTTMCR